MAHEAELKQLPTPNRLDEVLRAIKGTGHSAGQKKYSYEYDYDDYDIIISMITIVIAMGAIFRMAAAAATRRTMFQCSCCMILNPEPKSI